MKTILIANFKGGCGKTMTAITLSGALAQQGFGVALADADVQKSSLRWLKTRPEHVATIDALDWRKPQNIGNTPINLDYLIIDAPGSMTPEHLKQLVALSDIVVVPLQPSVFDTDSTKRFLKHLKRLKRVEKGQTSIQLVANRLRVQTHQADTIKAFFAHIEHTPSAIVLERSCYETLAAQGLSVFDVSQKPFVQIQAQWQPLLNKLL